MAGDAPIGAMSGIVRDGRIVGAWRSLVARVLWEHEVVGSNPSAPTIPTTLAVSPKLRKTAACVHHRLAPGNQAWWNRPHRA